MRNHDSVSGGGLLSGCRRQGHGRIDVDVVGDQVWVTKFSDDLIPICTSDRITVLGSYTGNALRLYHIWLAYATATDVE